MKRTAKAEPVAGPVEAPEGQMTYLKPREGSSGGGLATQERKAILLHQDTTTRCKVVTIESISGLSSVCLFDRTAGRRAAVLKACS